jgi:hypothetical protein
LINKVIEAFIQHQIGQVDWQVAKRLWAGSLPVALVIFSIKLRGGYLKVELAHNSYWPNFGARDQINFSQ